jgi:hypothetical protein
LVTEDAGEQRGFRCRQERIIPANDFQKSEFIHGRKDLICIQARSACMQGINIQAPRFNP